MSKPETPLQLLSTIVNCLTVLIEDNDTEPTARATYALIRDIAINLALDMQTERRVAA